MLPESPGERTLYVKRSRFTRSFDDDSPLTCKMFCARYFCEGQLLPRSKHEGAAQDQQGVLGFLRAHRKVVGIAVPAILVHAVWWYYMFKNNRFEAFQRTSGDNDIPRWYLSITMVFGSMLAGATSEVYAFFNFYFCHRRRRRYRRQQLGSPS